MKNRSSSIQLPNRALLGTALLIAHILMAMRISSAISVSRSFQPICLRRLTPISTLTYPKQFLKSPPCPLWSSSFSLCLPTLRKSTSRRRPITVRSFSATSTATEPLRMSTTGDGDNNPLLKDFDFPPFDAVEAGHVRPAICSLLKKLVSLSIIIIKVLYTYLYFYN